MRYKHEQPVTGLFLNALWYIAVLIEDVHYAPMCFRLESVSLDVINMSG
jgi:hypothetical protein